jgi:hypothetical protein
MTIDGGGLRAHAIKTSRAVHSVRIAAAFAVKLDTSYEVRQQIEKECAGAGLCPGAAFGGVSIGEALSMPALFGSLFHKGSR